VTAGRRQRRRPAKQQPRGRPAAERSDRLTTHEAADRLGLSERRLQQLVAEHRDVPTVGSGTARRYLWPALREWRDRQLVQQGVQSVRPQSVEEARARKLAAEADLKEIELAERRGALMPAALFRQELEAACARIRAHQLNAPGRYAPQLLEALADRLRAEDLPRAEAFIRQVMHEQMAELEAGDDIPDDDDEAVA
jgi:hypothetical protein